MQRQYWVTKKIVSRKLGGKEDQFIVSSDAELDSKLELLKSINDTCEQLQRVINIYQERLCYLAQEENALGRYLKECEKSEKNSNAAAMVQVIGKSLVHVGHQRLSIRQPLARLSHEVNIFKERAVSDTKSTVDDMEKCRTEYRAALSWMKSISSQLDPDTGSGLEDFRKAQSYVKMGKKKFDYYTLACLQKVDLLAAARCNMFSHALVLYQDAMLNFARKSSEVLKNAGTKLKKIQADIGIESMEEERKVIKAEDLDDENIEPMPNDIGGLEKNTPNETLTPTANLLDEDFCNELKQLSTQEAQRTASDSSSLLELNGLLINSEFLPAELMPSNLIHAGGLESMGTLNVNELCSNSHPISKDQKNAPSSNLQFSWLNLFSDLDPLAKQDVGENSNQDRA